MPSISSVWAGTRHRHTNARSLKLVSRFSFEFEFRAEYCRLSHGGWRDSFFLWPGVPVHVCTRMSTRSSTAAQHRNRFVWNKRRTFAKLKTNLHLFSVGIQPIPLVCVCGGGVCFSLNARRVALAKFRNCLRRSFRLCGWASSVKWDAHWWLCAARN